MHHEKRANAQQLAAQVKQFLVECINILIAALIGYLVLPRALARLWKRSEWSEGHMLQCKAKNGNPIPNLGDAIKLSIVPAYSNLHVLVMLAYLGILLSAFDSCVSRPCCIPSIVQTSTKTVLHVCTSWAHQHPCMELQS